MSPTTVSPKMYEHRLQTTSATGQRAAAHTASDCGQPATKRPILTWVGGQAYQKLLRRGTATPATAGGVISGATMDKALPDAVTDGKFAASAAGAQCKPSPSLAPSPGSTM
mmetsp:Transcript_58747/g.170434  ORF Transcript_58747/g.170434 Transcript_58747/m.170434 type:complete len:111 (+) Transcript_58747:3-335(+)